MNFHQKKTENFRLKFWNYWNFRARYIGHPAYDCTSVTITEVMIWDEVPKR